MKCPEYAGSYQEYLDDMNREDPEVEDPCPGCGRSKDDWCHPLCME